MVFKCFDNKSSGTSTSGGAIVQNQQLAEELHKPIIKKYEKQKVHSSFKGNIWGANFVDMQLMSKYNFAKTFVKTIVASLS